MKREAGSTKTALIVLLGAAGVAVVLFVLATVPCLLNAFDRGRQKATLETMERIARKLEHELDRTGRYPAAAQLDALFEGEPPRDGWGRPFRYEPNGNSYLLAGLGKDGEPDFEGRAPTVPVLTLSFEDDIVVDTGELVQVPEGMPVWRISGGKVSR